MLIAVDGAEAHAATGGIVPDAVAPVLVMVHGAGMDATVWQFQTRHFARHGYRVLAVDLPGHGRSAGPARTTVDDMADWLDRFLAAAGVERATVCGHSMGALIAISLAAGHPARVAGVGLLGVGAAMPVHPDLLTAAAEDLPHAASLITDWGFGGPSHIGGHPGPGLWIMGSGRALVTASQPGVLASDLKACADFTGAPAKVATIAAPILVIAGREDRMTPLKASMPLVDVMQNGRITVIEGAGHMMMAEKPYETARALHGLLEQTRGPVGTL